MSTKPLLFSVFFLLLTAATTTTTTTEPPTPSPTKSPTPPKTTTPTPTKSPTPPKTTTPTPTKSPTPPKTSTPTTHSTTLDPKQLTALQSLNIPTSRDPCSGSSSSSKQSNTTSTAPTTCDNSTPFRHLISLHLSNCSTDISLSYTALKSLSTLQSLSFTDCPVSPIRFPSDLSLSLHSFTCVHSLKHLTGVWLSRFVNLTDLTVTDVPVNASGVFVILGNMKKLRSVTISNANVTGYVPKHLNFNLTHVNFSGNQLKGRIPSSISMLQNLESLDLSSNGLTGEMPVDFGDLIKLKNVSLGSNSLSGSIPDSISAIPGLVHVDLSSNQFNGTIPKFFAGMKHLKYLNLEKNGFHGVLPFNLTFMNRLEVFKVGSNSNLCYNRTTLSSKLKLGIAPCDKHGLPMSPPPAKDVSSGDGSESDSSDYSDGGDDSSSRKSDHHHGPNKVVLGVAIALSSIVFLILFLIFLSKRCG